jgi:hypothetical protein
MGATTTAKERFLHVTSLELGGRTFYLVARCALCNIVVEREISEFDHDEATLDLIGFEILCAKGCSHVNQTVGSGVRPAFKKR